MIQVNGIQWEDGECVIQFVRADAVKSIAGVPVFLEERLVLPLGHPSYDQIRDLHDDVQELIRDVLEDYREAEPFKLTEDDEDDE